jgi:hypothetical protein
MIFKGKRRVGHFRVPARIYAEDYGLSTADVLRAAQEGCAILRCEYRVVYDEFDIDAEHPDFDVVPLGDRGPDYRAVLVRDADGVFKRTKFERLSGK